MRPAGSTMPSDVTLDVDAPTHIAPSHHPTTGPSPAESPDHQRVLRWLAVAIGVGIFVRMLPALQYDFPLNDGGLFYLMAVELKQAGFALPAVTQYNQDGIPFAYAPLGFYVAALLGGSPDGILAAVRWLPVIVSCLMLPAFALLARALLKNPWSAVAATFAFALLPRAFIWLIMGGGLTRSFGMLFSILALWQAHRLYTRRSWRHVPGTAIFASLGVLSHLGTAPFLVVSLALFFFAFGRHRHGILASAVVATLTLVLTAPWWATVIGQHGLAPFLAAQATGGSALSGSGARWAVRIALIKLSAGITGEPLFPIIYSLGILGALTELTARRFLLPVWWGLVIVSDIRAPGTYASLPIALLAGVAVTDALVPLLRRAPTFTSRFRPGQPSLFSGARGWPAVVLTSLVMYATLASLLRSPSFKSELPYLTSLTQSDRDAMRWVATSTPADSRILVVTGASWETDRIAEWFPVLAGRRSVGTVQGSEWLPGGEYARRESQASALSACVARDVECLERWAVTSGKSYSHVYIPKTVASLGLPGTGCCSVVLASTLADPRYERIYDGPGAAVFARRSGSHIAPLARR